ncbi:hypothetical protein ARMSODRAFT_979176 [Armillaria solidipes]|uniref:Uncharacterized protein n=1 Tax=Armillaria solidipes TaxID=1076256 RepID=A0A2H3BMR2_9AGAR|nr:hypothetical protein ARMSODRAFT_979176 [Armillaria solidipes]
MGQRRDIKLPGPKETRRKFVSPTLGNSLVGTITSKAERIRSLGHQRWNSSPQLLELPKTESRELSAIISLKKTTKSVTNYRVAAVLRDLRRLPPQYFPKKDNFVHQNNGMVWLDMYQVTVTVWVVLIVQIVLVPELSTRRRKCRYNKDCCKDDVKGESHITGPRAWRTLENRDEDTTKGRYPFRATTTKSNRKQCHQSKISDHFSSATSVKSLRTNLGRVSCPEKRGSKDPGWLPWHGRPAGKCRGPEAEHSSRGRPGSFRKRVAILRGVNDFDSPPTIFDKRSIYECNAWNFYAF